MPRRKRERVAWLDVRAPRQRVIAPADKIQGMLGHGFHDQVRLTVERTDLGDEEVHLARAKPRQQHVPIRQLKANADQRVDGDETPECRRDDRFDWIGAGTHTKLARLQGAVGQYFLLDLLGHLHNLARPLREHAADVGRHHAGGGTQEQRGATCCSTT